MQRLQDRHPDATLPSPDLLGTRPSPADPDESELERDLLRDLNRYPLRQFRSLFWLWLLTGIVGGHRYYLGQTIQGAAMTLTYGGLGLWWLRDGLRLRRLLNQYNNSQMARRTRQEPPLELAFLPQANHTVWERPYAFAAPTHADLADRNPSTLRGDALLVVITSYLLGLVCSAQGQYEPLAAVLLLLTLLNIRVFRGTSWLQRWARRSRLVQEILQWELKLRLFYHTYGVPKASRMVWRPITSLFRLFDPRHAGEARIYLDASYLLAAAFAAWDILSGQYNEALAEAEAWDPSIVGELAHVWFEQNIIVLVLTYAFVTPLGATLMKFDLSNASAARDRFVLSALALGAALMALV